MVPPRPATSPHSGVFPDYLEKIYLTQREVAEHLRLSERTLERHRVAGTGPAFVKLGRRVVYRREDIERWADARTHQSTSELDVCS
jgi:predicted DNA-binding transcriptional regulator AlpA